LAHHFFEAAPGGQAKKAVDYARLAGSRAAESLAYEEAARLQGMALTALELQESLDETLRVEILLKLGDAQTRAAEDERARETFLRAAGIAKRTGDASQLARAALGYGGIFVFQRAGADREMVPLLQDALMMLGEADGQLRVRLLSRLACALRDTSDREKGAALSSEAVKTARELKDPATLCYALEGRIAAIMWPENPSERLGLARELVELAERHDELERAVSGRRFEVVALCDLGLVAEARAKIDAVARESENLGQPNQLFIDQIQGTLIDLIEGDFSNAEASILAALDAGYSNRDEFSSIRSHFFLLRREQGRVAEIEGFVRSSVQEFPWYPLHQAALLCVLAELGRQREAQQLLDEISQDDFAMLHRDNEWLLGMALVSDGCAMLGDQAAASVAYEQLLPFAGRHAMGWGEGSMGAVDRYLGLLATTLGREDDAARHFEAAIAINDAMGARPWTTHCQHDYGVLLVARDAPGDRENAEELFAAALNTTHELGMVALEAKLDDQLDDIPTSTSPRPDGRDRGVFRREGEYWSVAFSGEAFRLRDTKGLGYMASLLAQPGREIHVLDLVGVDSGERTANREEGLEVSRLGDAGDVLDPEARAAYRRRLEELSEELDEAASWNDPERSFRAREEMDFLTKELAGAEGLGGRSRRSASASERARVNVTRAIRTAIAHVEENDPELGRHFDTSVRTGTFCSYAPDPRVPIDWQL
jgi:tetratricopeptide (TPR) repeat protein